MIKVKENGNNGYRGYCNGCFKFHIGTFINLRKKYQHETNQTDERQHKYSKECFINDTNIQSIGKAF